MPLPARIPALLAAAAAALSGGLALAGSASAQSSSDFFSIIPRVAPRVDVAQGAAFPLAARDSSGISFAESWRLLPAPDGHVFIVNRLLKDGTTQMAIDTQDTVNRGPSDPGEGAAAGTSPLDRSVSQQWKEQRVTFGGVYQHSILVNRFTKRKLAFNGSGFVPAYSQKANAGPLSDFVIKKLG